MRVAGQDQQTEQSPTPTLAVDGPGIDRSLFKPQLSTNVEWGCRWVTDQGEILCTASGQDVNDVPGWQPDWQCPDGNLLYTKASFSLVAKRTYDSDYKLVQRHLHWFGNSHTSAHADGSGKTASGTEDFFETDDYSIHGNTQDGMTQTIDGTDAKAVTDQPPHELLYLDKGELRTDPSGVVTIVSGRWDLFTDFDAAVARTCEALR
jgi:hypothetical protein